MSQVLIIDDSPTAVEKVRRVLVDEGHTVESLSRMIELGGMLRSSPPDLVLLDLNMPGLSGDGFAQLIHRFSAGSIPIIIYSSEDRSRLTTSARELRASGWVHKSDGDDTLREAVRSALAATGS
jgi:CheY-like chemotaxis protein